MSLELTSFFLKIMSPLHSPDAATETRTSSPVRAGRVVSPGMMSPFGEPLKVAYLIVFDMTMELVVEQISEMVE